MHFFAKGRLGPPSEIIGWGCFEDGNLLAVFRTLTGGCGVHICIATICRDFSALFLTKQIFFEKFAALEKEIIWAGKRYLQDFNFSSSWTMLRGRTLSLLVYKGSFLACLEKQPAQFDLQNFLFKFSATVMAFLGNKQKIGPVFSGCRGLSMFVFLRSSFQVCDMSYLMNTFCFFYSRRFWQTFLLNTQLRLRKHRSGRFHHFKLINWSIVDNVL